MQYSRLTLARIADSISELRLKLPVRCIGPSRHSRQAVIMDALARALHLFLLFCSLARPRRDSVL